MTAARLDAITRLCEDLMTASPETRLDVLRDTLDGLAPEVRSSVLVGSLMQLAHFRLRVETLVLADPELQDRLSKAITNEQFQTIIGSMGVDL